uniref:Putative product n=1 Tax=Xenopsylla cheopis TaxID=163159 RepID=A0A6M2E094_XENCH
MYLALSVSREFHCSLFYPCFCILFPSSICSAFPVSPMVSYQTSPTVWLYVPISPEIYPFFFPFFVGVSSMGILYLSPF